MSNPSPLHCDAMQGSSKRRVVGAGVLCLAMLPGCVSFGPGTVHRARFSYNEAVVRTWNEQMLLNLVRLRYRDTPLFLEINSVSTQYEFGGSAAASPVLNVDGGDDEVGLGAGIDYTERPTVTYTPLHGEQFVKQLLSPIPLESLLLLTGSGWSVERVLRSCTQQVNHLWNAPSASGPTPSYVPEYGEFNRAMRLLRDLQITKSFSLGASDEGPERRLSVRIRPAEAERERARELKDLLGLPADREDFVVTRNPAVRRPGEFAVQTRSLLGVMFYLSQAVEPPPAHEEQGRVTVTRDADGAPFDWAEVVGDLLRIRSSEQRPADAFVRVFYRGTWFYIDDTDLQSKSTFGLLAQLFNLQAGEVPTTSPLLTLPLGP